MEIAVVLLVAVLIFAVVVIGRTSALNHDERQQALAALIVSVLEEAHAKPEPQKMVKGKDGHWRTEGPIHRDFLEAWQDAGKFLREVYPNESPSQRRRRLAHALSMVKPVVSADDYSLLVDMGRVYSGD
jgi:hypothetical protein